MPSGNTGLEGRLFGGGTGWRDSCKSSSAGAGLWPGRRGGGSSNSQRMPPG